MPRSRPVYTACEGADGTSDTTKSRGYGFGEGLCSCAKCMRRAGPVREDMNERIDALAYILAGVPESNATAEDLAKVSDEHRKLAANLMTTVEENDCNRLHELFENDIDGDIWDNVGNELLISAAQLGHVGIIEDLCEERGADVDVTDDRRGGTPLMHAANNGHVGAVKLLLDYGADTEVTDDNGYTALTVSVFSDRSSTAEALIKGGAEVDAVDRHGRTALCYAAQYGSTDCIYLLANHGADVFHEDNDGMSPLDLAEDSGRTTAMEAIKKLQLKVKMQQRRLEKKLAEQSAARKLQHAELAELEARAEQAQRQLLAELEAEEKLKVAKEKAAGKKAGNKKKGKGHSPNQPGGTKASNAAPQPAPQRHASNAQKTAAHAASPTAGSSGGSSQLLISSSPSPVSPTSHTSASSGAQSPAQVQPAAPAAAAGHDAGKSKFWLEELLAAKPPSPPSTTSTAATTANATTAPPAYTPVHTPPARILPLTPAATPTPVAAPMPVSPPAGHSPTTAPSAISSSTRNSSAADLAGLGAAAAAGEPGSRPCPPNSPEGLRRAWEQLLEEACRCLDPDRQAVLLVQVRDMMPQCTAAGISIKYGRKVLQRLEAVGPARASLQAAMAEQPPSRFALEAALKAVKPVRSLLEPSMVATAESMLDSAIKAAEQSKWASLSAALSWDTAPVVQSAVGDSEKGSQGKVAEGSLNGANAAESHGSLNGSASGIMQHLMGGDFLGDASEDAELCVVCLAATKDVCCIPCGHVCMCNECAVDVQKRHGVCPVCRAELEMCIEILA